MWFWATRRSGDGSCRTGWGTRRRSNVNVSEIYYADSPDDVKVTKDLDLYNVYSNSGFSM